MRNLHKESKKEEFNYGFNSTSCIFNKILLTVDDDDVVVVDSGTEGGFCCVDETEWPSGFGVNASEVRWGGERETAPTPGRLTPPPAPIEDKGLGTDNSPKGM